MAINLAGVEDVNYMKHSTITQILNSELASLIELFINYNDAAFTSTESFSKRENILPADFYRLRSVKYQFGNKLIDENDYTLVNNKIVFNNDYNHIIEYWYNPPTLTYASPAVDLDLDTIYDSLDDRLVTADGIYSISKAKVIESLDDPENTFLTPLGYTTSTNGVLRYADGRTITSDKIPAKCIGYVDAAEKYIYYVGTDACFYKADTTDINFEKTDTMVYSFGENTISINNNIVYVDGIPLYQYTDKIWPLKIDIASGYGFIMGNKLLSVVTSTYLDFPSNLHFIVLAYRLAVAMGIILGKDVSGLQILQQQKEQQLVNQARRNLANVNRIKNVYGYVGNW